MLDKDDREMELLRYKPPDESQLSALRENRIREKQMMNKFVKLGDYLFVMLVLVLVSYGNRDPASFLMRNSLEQELLHPLTSSYPQGLAGVSIALLILSGSILDYRYEIMAIRGYKLQTVLYRIHTGNWLVSWLVGPTRVLQCDFGLTFSTSENLWHVFECLS